MFLLNYTFTRGVYSLDSTAPTQSVMDNVEIQHGIFDELFVSNDASTWSDDPIPSEWGYDTCLHALFNGTLTAGNVDFYLDDVTALVIKRRIAGTIDWDVIATVDVHDASDMSFERLDYTAAANTAYEYTVVPIINGVEGSSNVIGVTAEFDGLFLLCGSGVSMQNLHANLDISVKEQRNQQVSVVQTLGRKYPFVVHNSINDYDSGSTSFVWLPYDADTDSWDMNNGHIARKTLNDFLHQRRPILMKVDDGRIWIISISGTQITSEQENYSQKYTSSFEWTEIADANSGSDLREYGLLEG